jgi:hypothetical protein
MANYIARVELHNASYDDYDTLHESMKRRGFTRVIGANDGKRYQLPTGTYVAESSAVTLDQAYTAVVAAATDTGKRFWPLVADWTVGRFSLEQVK